jgi:type IV secretion system protein VirB9
MKRLIAIMVVALVVVLTALAPSRVVQAETLPQRGAADSRIRKATYNPDEIYRLYGFVGYAIELTFEEGETGAGNAGGDLEAITFGWHDNHLILKPKAANVGTNLVVYTNRRAYRFEYSASVRKPDPRTDQVMYAVRFDYPPQYATHAGPSAAELAGRDLDAGAAGRKRNLDYWFCGSPAVRTPGTVRSQRRWHRVAAEFQHGRWRCRHSSSCGAIHPAAWPADGLCGQQGVFRQWRASAVRNSGARGSA